jgi:hypothetical protein
MHTAAGPLCSIDTSKKNDTESFDWSDPYDFMQARRGVIHPPEGRAQISGEYEEGWVSEDHY